jgi:hypothetical protein
VANAIQTYFVERQLFEGRVSTYALSTGEALRRQEAQSGGGDSAQAIAYPLG